MLLLAIFALFSMFQAAEGMCASKELEETKTRSIQRLMLHYKGRSAISVRHYGQSSRELKVDDRRYDRCSDFHASHYSLGYAPLLENAEGSCRAALSLIEPYTLNPLFKIVRRYQIGQMHFVVTEPGNVEKDYYIGGKALPYYEGEKLFYLFDEYRIAVAEKHDGPLCGCVFVLIPVGEPPKTLIPIPLGVICGLYVEPEYRRKGFGRILLREALKLIKEEELTRAALKVENGEQNEGAIRLYQRGVFVRDPKEKDYVMVRDL